MKKPIKITVSVLLAIILLLVVAILAVPAFVDPNQFKPEISAAVKDSTGRDLTIDGDIKLSLFPWLGITTGALTLSNAQGFENKPFVTVTTSDISVQLLPLLLEKKIAINQLVLKGLALNLARNNQGLNNWDDFTKTPEQAIPPSTSLNQAPATSKTDALALFAVGKISVSDAQVSWQDAQADAAWLIKDLNLDTEQFSFDVPVNVILSLHAANIKSGFSAAIKLKTALTINDKFDNYSLSSTQLQSTLSGENMPAKSLTSTLTIADAALDSAKQDVKLTGLKLALGEALLSADIVGTGIKDAPDFAGNLSIAPFNLAKLLQELAISLPAMQDAKALNLLSWQSNLHATPDVIELQNLEMTLDDTHAQGQISVNTANQSAIGFDLALDTLALDRYLPPVNNSKKQTLASPGAALAAGAAALPVETLRKLNADGQITLGKLTVRGVDLQGVKLKLTAKDGKVATQQSVNTFYQGAYSGNISVDARNKKPVIALNEQLTKVQIEPWLKGLFKKPITGQLTASAQLQAQGSNADELKSTLNGHLDVSIKDAVIKGVNLQKIIDNGKALIKGTGLPTDNKDDQTLFTQITGTAAINNGLVRNDDLIATAAKLHVDGKGSANIVNETLNYQVNARLPAQETGQAPSPPLVIAITGPFDNLNYAIDATALLTDKARIEKVLDKNKDKINKLMNKLDKKLGPGTGDLLKGLFH
ncbi:MAG: AsmA family protein [Methylococcaceae bacterium]|nr:AsmA family protein [Methylococcaceae bacterium]MDP2392992.1 AsmA family protein [Methylococcaceae bacterium]MDP3020476.1 AsmA family protein [Methylococcaceae bacterium]MDP3389839.1 AsmA family protein [Methylococcaceae bacterium]MDP3931149.1 AsmA family protein [Methylococcaceae bacterium]